MDIVSISQFYANKSVFVTGFTGFLGKVFVERLLRLCPELHAVYVLIRPKQGEDVQHRLDYIFDLKLFEKLKKTQPKFAAKVIPILGDLLEPNLGLNHSATRVLESEISAVFHVAGTVNIDDMLGTIIKVNVEGMQSILTLCSRMVKLQSLVHVSSIYTNCSQEIIDEQFHDQKFDYMKVLNCNEWMEEQTLEDISSNLIGDEPDGHTFTKGLAESVISQEHGSVSVAIVRPSFIGATWREPLLGWTDSENAMTQMMTNVGQGHLHCMVGNKRKKLDIVPADIVANVMLCSAWYAAEHAHNNVSIFNCTSSRTSNLTWGKLEAMMKENFCTNPLNGLMRLPDPHFTTSRNWFRWSKLVNHQLTAYVIDFYKVLFGQRAHALEKNEKLWMIVKNMEYFSTREWQFENKNLHQLMNVIPTEDKKSFYMDGSSLHWSSYIEAYCLGIKKFCLSEKLSLLPKARANIRRLKWRGYLFYTALFLLLCKLLSKRVQLASRLWLLLVNTALAIYRLLPSVTKT